MDTTTRRRLVTLGLTALLLGACGGGGDGGDEPAAAAAAPSTTASTSTTEAPTTAAPPTTDAPATTAAEVDTARYDFEDTFDADSGWQTGCNDKGCAGIEDGYLYEDITPGEKEIDQHSEWVDQVLYDVTVATGISSYGAGHPEGGVACFADPDAGTYYDFTVGADGEGSIYRFDEAGGEALAGPFAIDGFTPEATVVSGTCNYQDDGSVRLTMEVNDQEVADVIDDDPLAPGEIGLVTYGDPDELSTIHFELVSVSGSELLD